MHAQAFKGKGDVKFDVGANFQEGGSGIRVSADFGLGENMSYGFATSYLLSVSNDDLEINQNLMIVLTRRLDSMRT
jgi:hypothetical protein